MSLRNLATVLVFAAVGVDQAAAATCESLASLKLPETTITAAQSIPAGTYITGTNAADIARSATTCDASLAAHSSCVPVFHYAPHSLRQAPLKPSATVESNTIMQVSINGIEFACNTGTVKSNTITDANTGLNSVPSGLSSTNTYFNVSEIRANTNGCRVAASAALPKGMVMPRRSPTFDKP